MIESIENVIQLFCTGISAVIALYRSGASGNREWTFLGLFSCAFFLGDLYWVLYLVFYKETPYYTYIPDLSWVSSLLFLLLFLLHIRDEGQKWSYSSALWIIPVVTLGFCVFYMTHGEYISNAVYAVLMTLVIWQSVNGLIYISKKNDNAQEPGKDPHSKRWVYIITLVFSILEYAMWTVSCFWMGDTLLNPYYWLDILLSVCFLLYLPAAEKAVQR